LCEYDNISLIYPICQVVPIKILKIALPFLATGIVIALRVRREEEAMLEKFGEESVQYIQRTGRFFPPINGKGMTA
jgi:protein-S-isoprenylcysteine O-methyltransferase Ste14